MTRTPRPGNAASRRLARTTISNRAIGRLLGAKTCQGCGTFTPVDRRLGFRVLVIVEPDVEERPDHMRVLALCSGCVATALAAIGDPTDER
jgi:hypothetical protein